MTVKQLQEKLDEISDEEFDRTMKTNLYGMFWICKAAVPHMPGYMERIAAGRTEPGRT